MTTKLDTPCREWQGAPNSSGYGRKQDSERGARVYVHRWVVAQIHGWEAIEGKVVMHLCDNPLCFRYDHLRIGSQADNVADMFAKERARNGSTPKTHCKWGHPFDDENTYVNRSGKRWCRACRRRRLREMYARRRA